jgi:Fe-Mn family superoxide dismutase
MDLDYLKKLAGIGETPAQSVMSLEQELAKNRREAMMSMMKEAKEEQLELEKLPYNLDALQPVLSKQNVDYHYDVLSRGYVTRYNNKEGDADFNYGGAKLHNLWWQQFKPAKESSTIDGPIKQTVFANYGDLKGLADKLVEAAMTIQGSGWVYLTKTGTIKTTPNQSFRSDVFMPIDMWEHSFTDYIPAKDAKAKYVTAVLKLIDWNKLNRRLEA